jgi:hypothetical protein
MVLTPFASGCGAHLLRESEVPKKFAGLLFIGALLGAVMTAAITLSYRLEGANISPALMFILYFVGALIFGSIPVYIANSKNKTHKRGICWLTFFSLLVSAVTGLGIVLYVASVAWAILDKKSLQEDAYLHGNPP